MDQSHLDLIAKVEPTVNKVAEKWDGKTTYEHMLNLGQSAAFKEIHDFFFKGFVEEGTSVNFYVLMGEAGTGKSFLTTTIIQDVLKTIGNGPEKLAVVAPTHKAVGVLRNYSPVRHHRKLEIATLASFCGLRPMEDHRDGSIKFVPTHQGSKVGEFPFVIVDEVSMMPKALLQILVDAAQKPNGPKILLIGDPSQLPPVKEGKISACFSKKYWESQYAPIKSARLTEQMRTSEGDVVHTACLSARKGGAGSLSAAMTTKVGSDSFIVQVPYGMKHRAELDPLLKDMFGGPRFLNNPDFAKIIAYTRNMSAKDPAVPFWNHRVRRVLFGEAVDAPGALPVFDTEAIKLDSPITAEEEPGKAGDTIVYNTDHSFWVWGHEEVTLSTPLLETEFAIKYDRPFAGYKLKVRSRYAFTQVNETETITIVNPSDQKRLNLYLQDILSKAKYLKQVGSGDAKIYWQEWYYWQQCGFARWSHDYARNVHTAQGSSYDLVLLDMPDMNRIIDPDTKKKAMYVALSRARKGVISLVG